MKTVSMQDVFFRAKETGNGTVMTAVEMGHHSPFAKDFWPEPQVDEIIDTGMEEDVGEFVVDGGRSDIISRCARAVSASVQFPVSTAFLHGMGIVATAMTPNFTYSYYGSSKKCNVYLVTSQPTGSGKSAVNDFFSDPVAIEYEQQAKKNRRERRRCMVQIERLEEQLKQAKDVNEIMHIEESIISEQEKMDSFPVYDYTWTDVTPEALEVLAAKQGGLFNLVSDEATIINSLLGDMYSDRIKNNEMLLKGWDGDRTSSGRVTRRGFNGRPNGNVVVCAQDETIKAIMSAGERGNGICQRFLMHREKTKMGSRNFTDGFIPIPKDIVAEYAKFIHDIMEFGPCELTFDAEASKLIMSVKANMEPTLANDAENSQELMRGVIAKIDKQIMKVACILHVITEWQRGGRKSKVITEETAMWAYSIVDALNKSFVNSASSQGYLGKNAEIEKLKSKISSQAEKGKKSISIQWLKDSIRSIQPFKGHTNLVKRLREVLLPELEQQSWIVVIKNDIHINPRLFK